MKEKRVLSYTKCPMNQVKVIQLIYAPYWDAMPSVYPKLYHSVLTEEIIYHKLEWFKIKLPILWEQNLPPQNVSWARRLFWDYFGCWKQHPKDSGRNFDSPPSCLKNVARTILDAWGWCTGTTQRDGMGREEGGGFRMGNTCVPVADSFLYLAKLIQLCKV